MVFPFLKVSIIVAFIGVSRVDTLRIRLIEEIEDNLIGKSPPEALHPVRRLFVRDRQAPLK